MNKFIIADTLPTLRTLPEKLVQCVVTSPPYYGLRDYGIPPTDWPEVSYAPMPGLPPITIPAQTCCLGLEASPEAFIGHLVLIFRETHRVLKDDGTLWVNIGDSYWSGKGENGSSKARLTANERGYAQSNGTVQMSKRPQDNRHDSIKPKDLILIPQRLALALQADGWYVRQEIIWHKPNPMPESVRDRCTKAHEQVWLLSKQERYYFDAEAIKTPSQAEEGVVTAKDTFKRESSKRAVVLPGQTAGTHRPDREDTVPDGLANRRSVWSIATKPYAEAHFAVFPAELPEICIKAGSRGPGTKCDCNEVILTPVGAGQDDRTDPTMEVGRAGFSRPRATDEGTRPITRREQRWEATQLRNSPFRTEIEALCGPAFAHYIRTDKAGARPLPPHLRNQFFDKGWISEAPPCNCPTQPGDLVLDPFMGSGTTAEVCVQLGRPFLGIERGEANIRLQRKRMNAVPMLFCDSMPTWEVESSQTTDDRQQTTAEQPTAVPSVLTGTDAGPVETGDTNTNSQ